MDLYLFRHAIAFEQDPLQWADDRQRPLTPKGVKRFRKETRGLWKLVKPADVLLSSSLVRAWDTAEILAEHAGWPTPTPFDPVEPGHSAAEALMELSDYADAESVGIVGHEPGLHELLSYLLTGSASGCGIAFQKGGVARISLDELSPGAATLRWLLPPRVLRKMARRG